MAYMISCLITVLVNPCFFTHSQAFFGQPEISSQDKKELLKSTPLYQQKKTANAVKEMESQ